MPRSTSSQNASSARHPVDPPQARSSATQLSSSQSMGSPFPPTSSSYSTTQAAYLGSQSASNGQRYLATSRPNFGPITPSLASSRLPASSEHFGGLTPIERFQLESRSDQPFNAVDGIRVKNDRRYERRAQHDGLTHQIYHDEPQTEGARNDASKSDLESTRARKGSESG